MAEFQVGDTVKVVGDIFHSGKSGTIEKFSADNKFVRILLPQGYYLTRIAVVYLRPVAKAQPVAATVQAADDSAIEVADSDDDSVFIHVKTKIGEHSSGAGFSMNKASVPELVRQLSQAVNDDSAAGQDTHTAYLEQTNFALVKGNTDLRAELDALKAENARLNTAKDELCEMLDGYARTRGLFILDLNKFNLGLLIRQLTDKDNSSKPEEKLLF